MRLKKNTPPVANNVMIGNAESNEIKIDEDTKSPPFKLIATDTDGDSLTYSITQPTNGRVIEDAANPGSYSYKPNDPNFSGKDSFSFTASDGSAESEKAMINIMVMPIGGLAAFKKSLCQPKWGFWHYWNATVTNTRWLLGY